MKSSQLVPNMEESSPRVKTDSSTPQTKQVKSSKKQRKFFVFDRDFTLATEEQGLINPQAIIPLIKTICTSDNLGWGIASAGSSTEREDYALKEIRKIYNYPIKRKPSYVKSAGGASTITNNVHTMSSTTGLFLFEGESVLIVEGKPASDSLYRMLSENNNPPQPGTRYNLRLKNNTMIEIDAVVLNDNVKLWAEGKYKLMAVLIALDEAYLRPIHNASLAKLGIISIEAPNSLKPIEMQDVVFLDDNKRICDLVEAGGCTIINADTQAADANKLDNPILRNTYIPKIYAQLPDVEKKRWIKHKFGSALTNKVKEFEKQISILENKESKKNSELNKNIVTQLNNLHQKLVDEILMTEETNANKTPYPIILDHFTHLTKQHIKKPLTQAQLQKSCDDLDEKLKDKPNVTLRAAICGVIGAFIGFTVGFVIGAVVTSWSGGWGALPAAILTAIGCYNLGVAIGSGLGAMGGFVIPSIVGFFHSKAKKKEFEERQKNIAQQDWKDKFKETYDSFGLSRKSEGV